MADPHSLINIRIGHHTDLVHRTGLTVFLFDRPLTCAAHLCGSAPGTRDVLPFMQLGTWVDQADALLFTGGSAYGLDAAAGVMSYLREKGQGLKIPSGTVVPLVPAACIFDLGVGSPVFPSAQDAYQACQRATLNAPLEGKVGAGTGATVNKCWVDQAPKEGGFSTETLVQGELQISVYAVVNAVGGLASSDLASHTLRPEAFLRGQNTVLIAVFCNASFNQNELMMIAKMASGGIAQSIQPAFTPYDGDMVFAFSAGTVKASVLEAGILAQQITKKVIQKIFI